MDDGHFAQTLDAGANEHQVLDAPIDSPTLRRLIDEVRTEEFDVSRSYNRTFNRHNR
jgi:hypothetical protein